MSDKQTWKEPTTNSITLANGQVVQAEVNGLSEDRKSGMIYVGGYEIKVMWHFGMWMEDLPLDEQVEPKEK